MSGNDTEKCRKTFASTLIHIRNRSLITSQFYSTFVLNLSQNFPILYFVFKTVLY
jgi:hypothetical protein